MSTKARALDEMSTKARVLSKHSPLKQSPKKNIKKDVLPELKNAPSQILRTQSKARTDSQIIRTQSKARVASEKVLERKRSSIEPRAPPIEEVKREENGVKQEVNVAQGANDPFAKFFKREEEEGLAEEKVEEEPARDFFSILNDERKDWEARKQSEILDLKNSLTSSKVAELTALQENHTMEVSNLKEAHRVQISSLITKNDGKIELLEKEKAVEIKKITEKKEMKIRNLEEEKKRSIGKLTTANENLCVKAKLTANENESLKSNFVLPSKGSVVIESENAWRSTCRDVEREVEKFLKTNPIKEFPGRCFSQLEAILAENLFECLSQQHLLWCEVRAGEMRRSLEAALAGYVIITSSEQDSEKRFFDFVWTVMRNLWKNTTLEIHEKCVRVGAKK